MYSCTEKAIEKTAKKSEVSKTFESKPISVLNKGFHKAIFSPNSNQLIASAENDKGLAIYDFKNDVMEHLNSQDGAGMDPKFTPNGEFVIFQSYQFIKRKRMTSIYLQNTKEKEIIPIVEDKRNLKLLSIENNKILFLEGENVKAFDISSGEIQDNPKGVTVAFTDNNLNLSVYSNGIKSNLNPLGEGNYIWVSLSPNNNEIIYNKTGKGTFICDLTGKTITDLGRLHAAKWSKDGKWVVGMNDYDDGHKYTKSDILMISFDGKTNQNLTKNSDVIALNPDISKDNSRIIYHNEEGRVYLMNLK